MSSHITPLHGDTDADYTYINPESNTLLDSADARMTHSMFVPGQHIARATREK